MEQCSFTEGPQRRAKRCLSGTGLLLITIMGSALVSGGAWADTVHWTGNGDGISWGNVANWDTGAVPGSSSNVYIEDGGGNSVVLTTSATVNSIYSDKDIDCQSASFTVKAPSTINGSLKLNSGYSLTVTGAGAELQVNGMAYISGANLYATSGGIMLLPFTEQFYSTPSDGSRTISASGAGSVIDLSNLTLLTGPASRHITMSVQATSGGVINFSSLEEARQNIFFSASGNGSTILFPSLTTLDATWSHQDFAGRISVSDHASILLPSLTTVKTWCFYASGGLTLDLSSVTHYSVASGINATISASGAGSVIDLSNLILLTGPASRHITMSVQATSGGVINFSSLEEARRNIYFSANGDGSSIHFPLLSTLDATGSHQDFAGRISIGDHASILLPNLTTVKTWCFYASGGLTLDLSSVTNYSVASGINATISASGAGSVIDLSNLTLLTGPSSNYITMSVQATSGGMVVFSSLEEARRQIRFSASGKESNIYMPLLTTIDSTGSGDQRGIYLTISDKAGIYLPNLRTAKGGNFYVYDGLTLDLSSLTHYSSPSGTVGTLLASGDTSMLDLNGLPVITGSSSSALGTWYLDIQASSGGTISFQSLQEANRQTRFTSSGRDSLLYMPSLLVFDGTASSADRAGSLSVADSGTAYVPVLQTIKAWSFYAYNGVILDMSSVVTCINNTSHNITILADGDGSSIDISNLSVLIGPSNSSYRTSVQAASGGLILLSSLESMAGTLTVSASGLGSTISLPVLGDLYGLNTTRLRAFEGGTVAFEADPFNACNVSVELSSTGGNPGQIQVPTLNLDALSRVSGSGIIQGDVISAGPIRPGGTGDYGALTIKGSCSIGESGSLEIDLTGLAPGVQYDQFHVTDTLYPNGTLSVLLRNGFVPGVNDKFDVLFYGDHEGTFPTVTGVDLGGGRELRTVYRPNRLVLGERAGLISPAVPVLNTPRNVPMSYDLRPHNRFADQPSWNIAPASTELYTATIDGNEMLTITPVVNEHGVGAPTLTLTDLADGFSDVQELDLTVALILPTAPTPFIFPTGDPLETDNLICGLLPGTVGPGCPILYQYTWSSQEAPGRPVFYPPFEPKTIVHGPVGDVVAILDASHTAPYERWTCTVHTYDGQYHSALGGAATSGVIQPLAATTLHFDLSPETITLGAPVTLSGHVEPEVGVVPVLFDAATPPGGTNTKPSGLNTDMDSAFSTAFLPDEAGSWGFNAAWQGNRTHHGDSATAALTVNKAQPGLLLSLSHTSALVNLAGVENFEIAAALSVAGFPPELRPLLAGRTVRLSIQAPDGQTPWAPLAAVTDASGVARFTKAMFDDTGVGFGVSGVWRFRAEFAGNENLRGAVTEDFSTTTARLTIKEGAGYAILALGRLDAQAEGHAEHGQTTDYIYSILRGRNFVDEDIHYLRDHLPGELDRGWPVDGAATAENLQYAIESWARDRMLASPAPLYLILVDHGSPGIFHMDIGHTGPNEYVTAQEIDGWLRVLQSALGQTKDGSVGSVGSDMPGGLTQASGPPVLKSSAADLDIVIVYGACHSGSFIPALSGPNRVLVTSSAAHELSYRGVINAETGLRDGDFFLTEFFRNAGEGRTLKDAFELACEKTYEYTATRTGAQATVPQHPQLDDNGDGIGTTGWLSTAPGMDGARVAGMDLGLGANAGNMVGWFTARPPVTLMPGGTLVSGLWAESTGREMGPGDTSWIEIKTPDYDGGRAATPGYEAFQQVAPLVGPIAAGSWDAQGGGRTRFSWSHADLTAQLTDGFTTPGTYKAYFFLRDGNTGQVGAYLVTNVYVSQAGNAPPAPVTLLYPGYDGIVNVTLFLAWTESVDPNADPVTYRVELSLDPAFPDGDTLVRDGLTDTVLTLGVGDGILNDHDYYWRVIPTDPYGATPDENAVGRFLVRGSPGVPGAITGRVTAANTSVGVFNASLNLAHTTFQGASTPTGAYFLGNIPQSVYTLHISAPGYLGRSVSDIIVTSGRFTQIDIVLESDGTNHPPVWTPIGNKHVVAGRPLAFSVSATDIDPGQTLTYSAVGLPPGATFDPMTREFRWTPTDSQARTEPYGVSFTVIDDGDPPLSATETIAITVSRGAHIQGPRYAVLGERVTLSFHAPALPGAWHVYWEHEGVVLPDEHNETLIIEAVTLDHAGWYTAAQVLDYKSDPVTAAFYLTVYEALPLRGWTLLAALVATATLVVMMIGCGRLSRGRAQVPRSYG